MSRLIFLFSFLSYGLFLCACIQNQKALCVSSSWRRALQCVIVACPGYAYLLFNAIGLSLFNEKRREKEIIEKYKSKQQQKQIKFYPALTASTVDRQNAQIQRSRFLDIFYAF